MSKKKPFFHPYNHISPVEARIIAAADRYRLKPLLPALERTRQCEPTPKACDGVVELESRIVAPLPPPHHR